MWEKPFLILLPSALCLVSFALRAYQLDELSLWYDEGWSVHLAGLAPWQALPQIASSGHTHPPPLYYLLLGMWQTLAGPSEFSMRFLSLAFGVLTVALGYRLGRELFDDPLVVARSGRAGQERILKQPIGLATPVASTVAFLLALAPSQIVYSQEARSYTLFSLEYALLILLTYRFLRGRWRLSVRLAPSPRYWAVLILAEVIALYTHYFALVLLAYLGLIMLGRLICDRRWAAMRRWMGAQLLVGLLYAPWIWTAIRQLGGHEPPDMQPLSPRLFLGLIWRFYFSGLSWAAANYPRFIQVTFVLFVLGGLSFLGNLLMRHLSSWDWLVTGSFLLPLGAVFTIDQVRPGLHPRYIFMLSVPLFLFLARQMALWLGEPGVQKLVGLGLVVVTPLSLGLGLRIMAREHDKNDVRGLATYLNAEATAQDLIIFDHEDFAFKYYYQGEAPVLYLEGYGSPDPLVRRVLGEIKGRRHAFLVNWYPAHTDHREIYPFLLELNGRLEDDRPFRGLRLNRYALQSQIHAPALTSVSADYGLFHLSGAYWEQSVPAGGAVTVALRWRLVKAVAARYKATVILQDGAGRQVASVDSPLIDVQGRPTGEWSPYTGMEVENYYVIPVPVGTPPLLHTLHTALYTEDAPEGLSLLSEAGAPSGKHFTLGEVVLTSPSIPQRDPYDTRTHLMLKPVGKQVAKGLALDAIRLDHTSVRPGTSIPVILFWRVSTLPVGAKDVGLRRERTPPEAPPELAEGVVEGSVERSESGIVPDYRPLLRLVRVDLAGNEAILAQQQGAPADGRYSTFLWREGETLLDRRELTIPPETSAGEARLEVLVGEGEPVILGTISVEVAERLFDLPSVQNMVYGRFSQVAELVGYDLPSAARLPQLTAPFHGRGSQAVSLTLYWRAINESPLPVSYVVFTHLLTEGGEQLVAQHDGPPGEGRQPTTSWVQGEVIMDTHSLQWWEEYTGICPIEVGLYDPTTGERLHVYDQEGNRLPSDRLLLDKSVICATKGEP